MKFWTIQLRILNHNNKQKMSRDLYSFKNN